MVVGEDDGSAPTPVKTGSIQQRVVDGFGDSLCRVSEGENHWRASCGNRVPVIRVIASRRTIEEKQIRRIMFHAPWSTRGLQEACRLASELQSRNGRIAGGDVKGRLGRTARNATVRCLALPRLFRPLRGSRLATGAGSPGPQALRTPPPLCDLSARVDTRPRYLQRYGVILRNGTFQLKSDALTRAISARGSHVAHGRRFPIRPLIDAHSAAFAIPVHETSVRVHAGHLISSKTP